MVPRFFTICLAGLGTVGKGVLLVYFKNKAGFRSRSGADIRISSFLARTPSKLVTALSHHLQPACLILDDPRLAVMVEVIGGTSDARRILRKTAITQKLFITANKTLLSCYNYETVWSHNKLLYEAAVAGGIPLVHTIRRGLVGNTILQIVGILNGTTNWMLSNACRYGMPPMRMAPEAVKKGYSEHDNSCDVDGSDAVQKTNILIATTYNLLARIRFVPVEGIRCVRLADILFAERLGFSLKLITVIRKRLGSIGCSVRPSLVSSSNPISVPSGTINAVLMGCNSAGRVWLFGSGAGSAPTSSSVLSDIGAIGQTKQSAGQLAAKDGAFTTTFGYSKAFYLRINSRSICDERMILEAAIEKGVVLSFHRIERSIILVTRTTLRDLKKVLRECSCSSCFSVIS